MKYLLIKKKNTIIILSILSFFFLLNNSPKLNVNKEHNPQFLQKHYDSRILSFGKALDFIKKCLSSDYYQFKSLPSINEPKISVVIPLYNCEKYIVRAVKSVQYQNISDIEIILVDDNSKDNTISIVEKLQNEDNRIRIIKNKNNKGVLYSRSIGVLTSKGKYLFTLDNDDIFLDKDIFDITMNKEEKGNFDIVEFKAMSNRKINNDILNNQLKDSIFSHQDSFILYQPELGRYPIFTGNYSYSYGLRDIFLWGKCIKTTIYKKALNKAGYERYSRFMIRYEDIITNYMIFNIADSFINIQKYGIYHFIRNGSGTSIGRKKVSRNTNILYLIDVVIDFSQNNENNKKLAAHIIIYILKLKRIKQTLTAKKYNMELIISCIKRVLNSEYISNNYKNEIRNIIKRLAFIKAFEIV